MRFVSQYTNFVLNIRNPKKKVTDFGVDVIEPEIVAEFSSTGWDQRDLDTAVLAFKFHGQFQFEDEATPVGPAYRLSSYDTDLQAELEGWDDETKAFVEQRLLSANSLGRDFVLVEELALTPPWPSYDQFDGDADALAIQVFDMGFDPDAVIAYEMSKWGQRREDVVAALTSIVEARDAGEIIVT